MVLFFLSGSFELQVSLMKTQLPKKFTKSKQKEEINTLLIDGNSLFKTSFHGAKNEFNSHGVHIGGIYSFLTTVRKLMNDEVYHKIFVFWDGKFSGKLRYELYSDYKIDRGKNFITGSIPDEEGYLDQQERTMVYLDTLYIKQLMDDIVESDDFIAYYCKEYKKNEKITICTNDNDMVQLIDYNVRIYDCGNNKKRYVTLSNYQEIMTHFIGNAKLIKVISGDASDSIKGIKGVKEKTLLTHFPMLKEKKCEINEIINEAIKIQEERISNKKKPLKALTNIINGVTDGIQKDIYDTNDKLINLSNPLLTKESIEALKTLKTASLEDNEDRGIKETLSLMKTDGVYNVITVNKIDSYLLTFKKYKERRKDNF